jgi:hypothetical protein
MGNEAMPSQLPEGTTWHAPGVQVERHGETVTIRVQGDWAVTGVTAEPVMEPREAAFADSLAEPLSDMVTAATIIQLQPRRGGP